MRIVYTTTARRHIASQIGYLVQQRAARPAKRLRARITEFIRGFLARHPKAGRYIGEHDIYESWIPRTPYVVMYRLDADTRTLTVLALFHSSQDRSHFKPPSSTRES
jgi:plasmid stabilization system protein ParE